MASFATFKPIVFCAIVLLSVSVYSDERAEVLAKIVSLHPIDVEITLREFSDVGSEASTTRRDCRVRFDGERLCYLADLSKSTPYYFNKQEALFTRGETIRLMERRAIDKQVEANRGMEALSRSLSVHGKHEPPLPFSAMGDVVKDRHCPMVGCIDGYFLSDYFPSAKTTVELNGNFVVSKSDTLLGKAVCKVDSSQAYLPIAFEVQKTGACYTNGSRILSSVLFDSEDERSALNKKSIALSDVVIKSDPAGRFYIYSCSIVEEVHSMRGLEGRFRAELTVSSIDLNPKFASGTLRPELKVTDGERFSNVGNPQSPYQWSDAANWVVPMAAPSK